MWVKGWPGQTPTPSLIVMEIKCVGRAAIGDSAIYKRLQVCLCTRDIMNISNAFAKHHDTYEMGGSQSDTFLSYICIGRRATSLRLSSLILLVMEGRCIDQNAIR